MHKKCYKCGQLLPVEQFSKNSRRSDGLSDRCKNCHAIYRKQHYDLHKQSTIDRVHLRRQELHDRATQYKVQIGCQTPGCTNNHPAILEFHHTDPSQKEINISAAIAQGWGWERLIVEIKKCIVVCSNCHKIIHWHESVM